LKQINGEAWLPLTTWTNLKFHDVYSFAGATQVVRTFRLNSIFDPDYTGVGGAPSYYTQLSALYERYFVDRAKVSVTFVQLAANDTAMCGITAHPSGEASVASNTACQQVLGEMNAYPPLFMPPAGSSERYRAQTVSREFDLAKVEGRELVDSDYSAFFGSDPVRPIMLDVIALNPSGGAGNVSLQVFVTIEFHVRLTGKNRDIYTD